MSKDQKAAAVDLNLCGTLGFPLHKPAGRKVRYRIGDLHVKHMLPLAGYLKKAVIGPDNLVILRAKNHHGQRRIYHGVLSRYIHITGHAVNVIENLPLSLGIAGLKVNEQQYQGNRFGNRQIDAEKQRRRCKGKQGQKVQPDAGLQHVGQLTLSHSAPPLKIRAIIIDYNTNFCNAVVYISAGLFRYPAPSGPLGVSPVQPSKIKAPCRMRQQSVGASLSAQEVLAQIFSSCYNVQNFLFHNNCIMVYILLSFKLPY